MTIELVLFTSLAALVSSIVSLWVFGYILHTHKRRILELYSRINYLEIGMSYHNLIPMAWESNDETDDEIKAFKQEGNIVYLQKEE